MDTIDRIVQRASKPDTIHDMALGLSPQPKIYSRVSLEDITGAEDALGFALPSFLKQLSRGNWQWGFWARLWVNGYRTRRS